VVGTLTGEELTEDKLVETIAGGHQKEERVHGD